MKAARQPVLPGAFEVELKRAAQVPEHGGLAVVGVRQHLQVETEVAGFRHEVGHRVEEPQTVVGTELLRLRSFLLSRTVAEALDDGQGAPRGDLTGEHELEAIADPVAHHRHDAKKVLHRVAKAKPVALAVVHHRGVARPGVGDERVVAAPDIGHVIEVRIRGLDLHRREQSVPVRLELQELGRAATGIAEFRNGGPAVRFRRADAKQHNELTAFARLEEEPGLKRAAPVLAFGQEVGAASVRHGLGIGVGPVDVAEKPLPHGLVAGDRRARERHPRAAAIIELPGIEFEIGLRRHPQDAVDHVRLDDELGILEVRQVVGHAPTAGEFAIGEDRELARLLRFVGHLQPPVLEQLAERNEVGRLRLDAAIARRDDGVGGAVAAGALVSGQRFADRLPGGAPIITARLVPEIEIAARLVHRDRVGADAQEPAVERTAVETVAAGVVRDNRSILDRTEVIAPWTRRVRTRDDVLFGGIVEIAVVHRGRSGRVREKGPGAGRAAAGDSSRAPEGSARQKRNDCHPGSRCRGPGKNQGGESRPHLPAGCPRLQQIRR